MNSLFSRNFDRERVLEEEVNLTSLEAPLMGRFTQEELDAVVSEKSELAYRQGFEAGYIKAKEEFEAGAASTIAAQTVAIGKDLHEITSTLSQKQDELETSASLALSSVVELMLGELNKRLPRELILQEMMRVSSRAFGSNWLEISAAPQTIAHIQSGITDFEKLLNRSTKLKLNSSNDALVGQVTARWENGESEYDVNLLCSEIIDTISHYINKPK